MNKRVLSIILSLMTLAAFPKDYKFKIVNSLGEPQKGVIVKFMAKEYVSNARGMVEFTFNSKSTPMVNFYFPEDPENSVKKIPMTKIEDGMTFRLDSKQDLARFKLEGVKIPVEGFIVDENNEEIEGAEISILGTGSKTVSDEIGLFQIEADFGHKIMIRAQGKENRTLTLEDFLKNQDEGIPDEPLKIRMKAKNAKDLYSTARRMPEFKGGMRAFWSYMERNLVYPEKDKAAGREGVVIVQFVVEKDGTITEPKVMRKATQAMNEAALALIEHMPEWTPASDNGKLVRCKYSVPVKFELPKPKPEPVKPLETDGPLMDPLRTLGSDSLRIDSLALDSLALDSLALDSIARDSLMLKADSIAAEMQKLSADSLALDSLALRADTISMTPPDSIADNPKALKKWLKQQKKAEKKRLKQLKKEEKLRLKAEKKRLKQLKKEEKLRLKEEKKRLKEGILSETDSPPETQQEETPEQVTDENELQTINNETNEDKETGSPAGNDPDGSGDAGILSTNKEERND